MRLASVVIEQAWSTRALARAKVRMANLGLQVISCYLPHSGWDEDSWMAVFNELQETVNEQTFVAGDFNMDLMWIEGDALLRTPGPGAVFEGHRHAAVRGLLGARSLAMLSTTPCCYRRRRTSILAAGRSSGWIPWRARCASSGTTPVRSSTRPWTTGATTTQ